MLAPVDTARGAVQGLTVSVQHLDLRGHGWPWVSKKLVVMCECPLDMGVNVCVCVVCPQSQDVFMGDIEQRPPGK